MPTYTITDPNSGRSMRVTGDSSPTEGELYQLFAVEGGPETRSAGIRQSLADTGMRTLRGIVRSPLSALQAIASPVETAKGIGREVASGFEGTRGLVSQAVRGELDPEVGGEMIGGLLMGRFAPNIARGARTTARYGFAIGKGVAKNVPGASMVKGAAKEVRDMRTARAIDQIDAPANVAKSRQSVFDVSKQRSGTPAVKGAKVTPAATTGRSRALSAGEESGVSQLDRLLDAIHGQEQLFPGNGLRPAARASRAEPLLTRNPQIGVPRKGPTSWDMSAGPAITAGDQALLAELARQNPRLLPTRTATLSALDRTGAPSKVSALDRYKLSSAEPGALALRNWLKTVGGDIVGRRQRR